ncbi:MAG TPA: fatty acid desaturase family protein [Polyangia bacterium]|nr:fatty acid desaturase family protein [Polyangia bacterium]
MDINAQPQPYGRGHRALEIASITFVFLALGWLAYRIFHTVASARDLLWIFLTAVTGYLVADFLSGFVHWAGDTIGDQNTPVFGPNFVTPFRYHHVDPKDITRHDFVETNGNNCIVVAPILALLLLVIPRSTGWFFYACATLAFTSWFVFLTNQFHKWAHADKPAGWVRALQRAGLILSPEHHSIHHASPQDKSYCITVGWMNPLLDKIGFFRICETVIDWAVPGAVHSRRQPG